MHLRIKFKGSFLVENAIIVPMFLFIICMIINLTVLFHDKLIIKNAVLQAEVELNNLKYGDDADESDLSKRIKDYVQLKTLFAKDVDSKVVCDDDKFIISCTASFGASLELFKYSEKRTIDVKKEVSASTPVKVIRITKEIMEVISTDE